MISVFQNIHTWKRAISSKIIQTLCPRMHLALCLGNIGVNARRGLESVLRVNTIRRFSVIVDGPWPRSRATRQNIGSGDADLQGMN